MPEPCYAEPILDQAALDQLEGCEVIGGSLYIAFPVMDLRPLHALKTVLGSVYLSTRQGVGPFTLGLLSLEGLENLERVGLRLAIDGAIVSSLTPLRSLRSVGTASAPGDLVLYDMQGLENLAGLEQLDLEHVNLDLMGNPQLRSLQPLAFPPHMAGRLLVRVCPQVADLGDFSRVESLAYLDLNGTSLQTLDSLRSLKRSTVLEIVNNALLRDASGLAGLEASELLTIAAQPLLESLPDFPQMTEAGAIQITNNAALTVLPRFPNLTRLGGAWTGQILIRDNPVLQSAIGFEALAAADSITIQHNPQLVSVSFEALREVSQELVVTSNAQLAATSVTALSTIGALTIKIAGNQPEPLLLDPCPWVNDYVCDAPPNDTLCALGSDEPDCSIRPL